MKLLVLLFAGVVISCSLFAQDLVYKPKNPAFGGDTFNYQWLLSSAQAQDTYKDPSASTSSATRDPLEDFENNLNRQILYQLSRQLVSQQFGSDGLEAGTYEVGSYQIEITESADGISVSILDVATGSKTNVLVPNLQ
ncbi:curli production assembly/transport component CsgF [Carboxylicivirga taeanensis]|uniref:curli production assembly/transport component CsgF n=1 Tax=Carboxylicivirga taeanensis TaxID=1416875 RepID=UPI003F6E2B14